jgi:hypothetical protein
MATSSEVATHPPEPPIVVDDPLGSMVNSRRFDWRVTALALWFMAGLFLDGWAHTHGRADETFFTPWHAVLYSGHLAVTAYLFNTFSRNVLRGSAWRDALPMGYGLSLVGCLLFAIGGVGDLIWHTLFGIEQNVEALFSPTHLLLAIAGALIVSGPLRAAWRRLDAPVQRLSDQIPAILSATFLLSILTFFTQIAHPLANLWAIRSGRAAFQSEEQGVLSLLLDAAIYAGLILMLIRRWTLALGALSLIFALNAIAMGCLLPGGEGPYPIAQVAARILAGIVIDLSYQLLHPAVHHVKTLRVFAFTMPLSVSGLYFLSGFATVGLSWSIHLWAGSIVMTSIVGLLMSYIAVPTAFANRTRH